MAGAKRNCEEFFERLDETYMLPIVGQQVVTKTLAVGAVQSGKSSYFRSLCHRQPHATAAATQPIRYFYWDLLKGAQATSEERFWRQLAHVLQLPEPISSSAEADLIPLILQELRPHTRNVVVLDNWDDAREYVEHFIHLPSLELLTDLTLDASNVTHATSESYLGLIAVSRFPNADALVEYAYENRGPGFVRFSGGFADREASIQAPFPFMTRKEGERYLKTFGIPAEDIKEIISDCGGWPVLLSMSIDLHARSGYDEHMREQLRSQGALLLQHVVLPAVARHTGRDSLSAAWKYIEEEISRLRGTDLMEFYTHWALPTVGGGLPRCLQARTAGAYLVVDTENLVKAAPPVADPGWPSRFIRWLAARESIHPSDVHLVGQSEPRLKRVMGTCPDLWNLIVAAPPASSRQTAKGATRSLDDAIGTGIIGLLVGRDPSAVVHLVTGDSDYVRAIARLPFKSIVLHAPYQAPATAGEFEGRVTIRAEQVEFWRRHG